MRMLSRAGALLIAAMTSLAAACASAPAPAAVAADPQAALLEDYVLGPSDKVRLIVFNEPDLSGEFALNSRGQVSLPLLGDIDAAGLTVEQLAAKITASLSQGYINDARVAAEVITYRPYYILGEVAAPGEYPYSSGMTVIKAVAAAKGFTYRAKKSVVYVKRSGAAEEVKMKLTPDLVVLPGDVVRVGERFF